MAFKVYYSPTIIMHYCPPVHNNIFPGGDVDVDFFLRDPPANEKKPPYKEPPKKKVE